MEVDPQVLKQRVLSLLTEYISSFWVPLRMQQKLLSQHLLNGSNALQLQTFVKSSSQRCLTVSKQSSSVIVSERLPESIPQTVLIILIKKASFATSIASLFDLAENLDVIVVNLKGQKDLIACIFSMIITLRLTFQAQKDTIRELRSKQINESILPLQKIQSMLQDIYARSEQYKRVANEVKSIKQNDSNWQQLKHLQSLKLQIESKKQKLQQIRMGGGHRFILNQIQKYQPALINAIKGLQNISNNDYNTWKGFVRAPLMIQMPLKALYILLQNRVQIADRSQKITFQQIKSGILRPDLVERLRKLRIDDIHDFIADRITQNFARSEHWKIQKIAKVSNAAGILAVFVQSFLVLKAAIKRLQPQKSAIKMEEGVLLKQLKQLQQTLAVLLQKTQENMVRTSLQAMQRKVGLQNQIRQLIIQAIFTPAKKNKFEE